MLGFEVESTMIEVIAPGPTLDDLPPPTLYWMNRVVFGLTELPSDILFRYLFGVTVVPNLLKLSSRF